MDNTPNQAGGYEDRQPLSAEDVAQSLRRRLWAIFLAPLAIAGTALAFSLIQTPTDQASTTVLVGQQQGQGDSPARVEELQALIPSSKAHAFEACNEKIGDDPYPWRLEFDASTT